MTTIPMWVKNIRQQSSPLTITSQHYTIKGPSSFLFTATNRHILLPILHQEHIISISTIMGTSTHTKWAFPPLQSLISTITVLGNFLSAMSSKTKLKLPHKQAGPITELLTQIHNPKSLPALDTIIYLRVMSTVHD